jgi:hypothetical protein
MIFCQPWMRIVKGHDGLEKFYLVVGRLALADLVLVRGPEARAVGREDFVDEHDLARLVEAKLEFGVGDDDAALFGVLPGLEKLSQYSRDQFGNVKVILPSRRSTS